MSNIFSSLASFAHMLIEQVVKPGDAVIDATAGNGNDTLFLAQLVGPKGKVYAFDIQDVALKNTYDLLKEYKVVDNVFLFKCGHENLHTKVSSPVKSVIFNLGYLPKGNHSIITLPETSIRGIVQAMNLLEVGGLITITVYTGHQGGSVEESMIEDLVTKLDKKKWDVLKWSFLNKSEIAPYLIALYSREGH